MKQKKYYTLVLIGLILLIAVLASCSQKASYSPLDSYVDATIQKAKDSAVYANQSKAYIDSLHSATAHSALKDYQLDLHEDTVRIFDGERLVGTYISNWQNQMDSIILKDNQ